VCGPSNPSIRPHDHEDQTVNLDEHQNVAFRADTVGPRLSPVLRNLVQATSRLGFSVSLDDLAEIEAGEMQARQALDGAFAMMREQALARRRNLADFEGVEVVSIGQDCFSRTVLTRWGLKKFSALGEKSGPFDLSVHRLPTTAQLIETDFDGYMTPSQLVYNAKLGYCQHTGLGTHFNHEKGPEFSEDGFAPLIARYASRIDNFQAVMASGRPTALVLHVLRPSQTGTGAAIDGLWKVIERRWGGEARCLIAVNTWPHGAEIVPTETRFPERVTMIDIAYPAPKYVWHMPEHSFSEGGCAFEREVVTRVGEAAACLVPRDAAASAPATSAA
jgi:hypothetical protein